MKQTISIGKFIRKRKVSKYKEIIKGLFEKKGIDVLAIDVSKQSSYTDFLILCTANSNKHAQTLADKVIEEAKKNKMSVMVEGYQQGEWILLDLGSFVIHVFLDEIRNLYDIEGLWYGAPFYYIEEEIETLK
ncbi:MAG: ribosome silencing factor [Proteobacteria bacterium]|nr:ribosome silencing factor [Pseudomonadota bacterium]